MLLQNIWHMFKYLLKTQIRCFFTTYSHAGQKWNFRFLPQSNFLTTEFFNEEFLTRCSFLVKNFLQNQSSTSQLYIALSAINKYEILFWTDSSEKWKKMAKSANPPHRLSSKFGAKKSKIWIFWNKYYNNRKMLRVLKQDPWGRSFPILIFSRSFENFWKSRFFILKSLFLDLKMPQLFEDTFFSTQWVPNEEFFWKIKNFKS